MVGSVCTQRDGNGNSAGPNREGQGKRIKCTTQNIGRIDVLLNLLALVSILLSQHGPTGGDYDESATDLDYRNRNTEKSEDVGADNIGSDDEDETVERNAPCEQAAGGSGVILGEGEEDGAATD